MSRLRKFMVVSVVASGALALMLVVGIVIGYVIGSRPAVQSGAVAVPGKKQEAKSGKATTEESDRAALMAFIKSHAQDPSGLEIVELKPATRDPKGSYVRWFKIRCKVIEMDGGSAFTAGTGKPLSLDTGTAEFSKDGQVTGVHLDRCFRRW